MHYIVGYTIAEDIPHGIKASEHIVAQFETYIMAEDFVNKCMPAENKDRFFIRKYKW